MSTLKLYVSVDPKSLTSPPGWSIFDEQDEVSEEQRKIYHFENVVVSIVNYSLLRLLLGDQI